MTEDDNSPNRLKATSNNNNKPWEDGAERDEKGRYIDTRHEEDEHNYYDYNDYKYIDEELETCGTEVNWITTGKVGEPKQQNTCGSCWAHSTIASVETLYAILKNTEHTANVTIFSEQ